MMLYLIGEPGTGKTHTMNALLDNWLIGPPVRLGPQFYAEPFQEGWHLGRRRSVHGGTDALGMGCLPAAKEWIVRTDRRTLILGEGQRLGNAAFIEAALVRHPVIVVWLDGPAQAEQWRAERGTRQSPAFVKGAATRAERLYDNLRAKHEPRLAAVRVEAGPDAPGTVRDLLEASW